MPLPPFRRAAARHSVLIVDDENGVRDLMTRWLESGGYAVTTAASAEEALGGLKAIAARGGALRHPHARPRRRLARRAHPQRYPETAVIMATGVQDVGPRCRRCVRESSTT